MSRRFISEFIPRAAQGLPKKLPIRNVDKVIAVASGKGGVGKSTVATNIAISAMKQGKRVGLLDADIFGPSIPKLMGLEGKKANISESGLFIPLRQYGIQVMSMGFLMENPDAAIVWRGLMVMKAIERLVRLIDWSPLDVLFIDMPPGTGDTQLSICQLCILNGAVIVSTPQDVALIDVRKGIDMFGKVGVKTLGIVQNMSVFRCPSCGTCSHVFGKDGAGELSKELNVELLGDVPLMPSICKMSDGGTPISLDLNEKDFCAITEKLLNLLK